MNERFISRSVVLFTFSIILLQATSLHASHYPPKQQGRQETVPVMVYKPLIYYIPNRPYPEIRYCPTLVNCPVLRPPMNVHPPTSIHLRQQTRTPKPKPHPKAIRKNSKMLKHAGRDPKSKTRMKQIIKHVTRPKRKIRLRKELEKANADELFPSNNWWTDGPPTLAEFNKTPEPESVTSLRCDETLDNPFEFFQPIQNQHETPKNSDKQEELPLLNDDNFGLFDNLGSSSPFDDSDATDSFNFLFDDEFGDSSFDSSSKQFYPLESYPKEFWN